VLEAEYLFVKRPFNSYLNFSAREHTHTESVKPPEKQEGKEQVSTQLPVLPLRRSADKLSKRNTSEKINSKEVLKGQSMSVPPNANNQATPVNVAWHDEQKKGLTYLMCIKLFTKEQSSRSDQCRKAAG
jgi:hypothetical protein